MGGASRFLTLLTTTTTPFSSLLHHRPSNICFFFRRFPTFPRRLFPLKSTSEFHSLPINSTNSPDQTQHPHNYSNNNASSSSYNNSLQHHSHPWPEWSKLIDRLFSTGRYESHDHGIPPEDAFVAYEKLSDDFVRAAAACLAFARDRPDIIGSLSVRNIEVVVRNGTPFLFKNALDIARRMRAFLGVDGANISSKPVLDSDKATAVDLMKYLLSYVSKPLVPSEGNNLYSRELVNISVRSLLHELTEVGWEYPARIQPVPEGYQFSSGSYGQFSRPFGQNIEMKRGDWICPKCSFMNFARNINCIECEEHRPKRQLTGREWSCPQCNFFNYGKNVVCLRCDCKRPHHSSLNTVNAGLGLGSDGEKAYRTNMDNGLSENAEKTQRWYNQMSQLDNASSSAADEEFPEIMPSSEGVNRFVESTRKTPLGRRLTNNQSHRNLGTGVTPGGNVSQMGDMRETAEESVGNHTLSISGTGHSWDEREISSPYPRSVSAEYGNYRERNSNMRASEVGDQTPIDTVNRDFKRSEKNSQFNGKPESEARSIDKERDQIEKSERWFKRVAELHDVKDLPSAILDEDFPEIMPMRKGENRFVVSKKKDRSLTSPMYRRQVAMEQVSNSDFVPFVPFPPGYFAQKETQETLSSNATNSSMKYTGESISRKITENFPEKVDAAKEDVTGSNVAQNTDDKQPSQGNSNVVYSEKETKSQSAKLAGDVTASTQSQSITSGWKGKSLEGSAVKEPDPLDMSEEAKAERWFRRVAQIKDISELSQIPDEDFPSIMPMRKGVNRFVVSKRKTPLERRLTSPQYRRNLPVVSSGPKKDDDSSSEK